MRARPSPKPGHTLTVVLVVLLAVFVAIAALWFAGGAARIAGEPSRADAPAQVSVERGGSGLGGAVARTDTRARTPVHRPDPRAREALRQDIVRALQRRGVDTQSARSRDLDSDPDDDEAERSPASGGMVDRIGNRPALLERMNADFMPLADECIEHARERIPELHGLVAIDAALLAERDVGAIVESAAPAAINEVADPELLECLQESLLSMALPGDAIDGLDGITISLRTDADEVASSR